MENGTFPAEERDNRIQADTQPDTQADIQTAAQADTLTDAQPATPAEQPAAPAPAPAKKKSRVGEIVGNVVFYAVLLLLVVGVFVLRSGNDGAPVSLAGYTAQVVLTGSMEDAIPKGSLVLSKKVDAATLQIGDDITFLTGPTTTVTHRIVGIIERYGETNQRAFQTQGVMNDAPDREPVAAVNVVGKVVFHSLPLGRVATFLSANWPLVLFLAVLVIVFVSILQYILRKTPDGPQPAPGEKKRRKKTDEITAAAAGEPAAPIAAETADETPIGGMEQDGENT